MIQIFKPCSKLNIVNEIDTNNNSNTKRVNRNMWVAMWNRNCYPSGAPEFTPGFRMVRVARLSVYCFVDRCMSICPFSFGHCVVCPPSTYGFLLPLCYLKTVYTYIPVHTQHESFPSPSAVAHITEDSMETADLAMWPSGSELYLRWHSSDGNIGILAWSGSLTPFPTKKCKWLIEWVSNIQYIYQIYSWRQHVYIHWIKYKGDTVMGIWTCLGCHK